jgi:hypothetical protein
MDIGEHGGLEGRGAVEIGAVEHHDQFAAPGAVPPYTANVTHGRDGSPAAPRPQDGAAGQRSAQPAAEDPGARRETTAESASHRSR